MTPKLVERYSKMLVIQDNPNWWMIKIFNGFGVHICNLNAMKNCYDNKIMYIKEEGGKSHVYQAYDILGTNNDK